ncbi:decapping and exoribonuclease protein-like [Argiope bruennichi]|uniref:decapping and exoribonuclease protein-like n=1 Tax=Argiope bruennichi TaxID=94029 RepID=UPI0024942F73|nr:decapping and exoribonuclease protein-like [Argiope bruennichi]
MNFHVKRSQYYDGRFPPFRKPSEIGYFSLDGEREYHDDNRQLKYIILPRNLKNVHMDLNVGYEDAVRKDFGKKEKIDTILTWILYHQEEVKKYFYVPNSNKPKIDFVCFRGLLTTIGATIYENKEDWLICATKFRSVIYLCAFDTDQNVLRRETATERDKLMSSWGYKFEQYLAVDSPSSKPNPSIPVNEKEEYCIVLKGRFNNHTLLYSAEVDGKDTSNNIHADRDPQSTQCYTELKTSRIITAQRQHINFCRYKLLKWWLQSFLVGIPKIICGFRDDQGIVRNLEVFPVAEIPRIAQNHWTPASTLNFCSEFMDYVKKCVKKDDPSVVYKFYWKPGSPVTCEELTSADYQVLPEWYTNNLTI